MSKATSKEGVSHPTIKEVLSSFRHLTATEARKKLGLSQHPFDIRIKRGVFQQPTYISQSGHRYFDEEWVKKAQAILNSSRIVQKSRYAKPIELRVVGLICELDYDGDKELLPEWLRKKIEEAEQEMNKPPSN